MLGMLRSILLLDPRPARGNVPGHLDAHAVLREPGREPVVLGHAPLGILVSALLSGAGSHVYVTSPR